MAETVFKTGSSGRAQGPAALTSLGFTRGATCARFSNAHVRLAMTAAVPEIRTLQECGKNATLWMSIRGATVLKGDRFAPGQA
jgi:hypothetical protein